MISTIKKLLFKSGRITKEWACRKKKKTAKKIYIPAKKVDIAGCFSMSDIYLQIKNQYSLSVTGKDTGNSCHGLQYGLISV